MEANKIAQNSVGALFILRLIQFKNRLMEFLVECLMMPTNRSEQYEDSTVTNKITLDVNNRKANLTKISERSVLIPRQTKIEKINKTLQLSFITHHNASVKSK